MDWGSILFDISRIGMRNSIEPELAFGYWEFYTICPSIATALKASCALSGLGLAAYAGHSELHVAGYSCCWCFDDQRAPNT